jgi:hypothetical protein
MMLNVLDRTAAEPCSSGKSWNLWEFMQKFDVDGFLNAYADLVNTAQLAVNFRHHQKPGGVTMVVTSNDHVISTINILERACAQLGLTTSKQEALRAKNLYARLKVTNGTVHLSTLWLVEAAEILTSLISRLQDEFNSRFILYLNDQEQHQYEQTSPLLGQEFANKFSREGAYELDEAAKCLALGRSTAAVFHLMRLMEIGIKSIARCLRIPDPIKPAERNWGFVLGEIKKGIENKWSTSASRNSGDGAFFESLYATLDAVRNPWRNATMHVESKYTEAEAQHIFNAVAGFMRKLASRCDEDGEPKA